MNLSRTTCSCCLTKMRHVFVWWDTDIQEIPRRRGQIQTLRTRVPKPWVQPSCMAVTWLCSRNFFLFLYKKKLYFLNWLNYWPAISALVYMYLHVQWLDHLELKGSVSWFWVWLSLNLNWHSYQDKNALTVTDCPYRAMNSE